MMPFFQLFLLILAGNHASGWLFSRGCDGYRCRGGKCIRSSYLCDGDNDCGNWDDEDRCRAQIRLVPGPLTGRLEVKGRGEWGTVCDDNFGFAEAKVVCKSLGFYGMFAGVVSVTDGTGRIWLDDVGCLGRESSLDRCSHASWGVHNCNHNEDVGVTCPSSVPTRLNGSRVEVNFNGAWGTVCDDDFGTADAKVVCRSLGLPTGYVQVISVSSGSGPIWMDNVACSGSESSLSSCRHRGWGVENCEHGEDIGVKCLSRDPNLCTSSQYTCRYGKCISRSRKCNGDNSCGNWKDENYCSSCSNGAFGCGNSRCRPQSIVCNGVNDCGNWADEDNCVAQSRLVPGPREGRLEVKRRGEWGTVCSHSFTYLDAQVACRSLGLTVTYAQVVQNAGLGRGSGRIWLDDVECTGAENSLDKCSHRSWGNHNCNHGNDVGVKCSSYAKMRLSPGPSEGRVEVYRAGVWGAVCDASFTYQDAKVVCKSLGLYYEYAMSVQNTYGKASETVQLRDVSCSGDEVSLSQCSHGGWAAGECHQGQVVAITCYNIAPSRLVPGPREGRLEVKRHGEWGTVCSHSFSYLDAKVACRSLNFSVTYAQVVQNAGLGRGSGRIWLDDVECTGAENSLDKCSHRSWGNNNCNHGDDVGIRCSLYAPMHLAPGPSSGSVEVYRHGVWGTVCGDGFSHLEGQVVCRDLGLETSYVEVVKKGRSTSQTTLLSDVDCFGNETSFEHCNKTWDNSSCDRHRQVGIKCNMYPPMRLVPGPSEGRVEVYRAGVWGAVCDANFTYQDAKVVCKSLGLQYDYAMSVENSFEPRSETVKLSDVSCVGEESSISQCTNGGWDAEECTQSQVAAISCYQSIPFRITPGPRAGRLEVYRRGQWGAVCADSFTYNTARVVCVSLGFQGEYAEVMNNQSTEQMTIIVKKFTCSERETSLGACALNTSSGICAQGLAGVKCHSTPPHRLVPGPAEGVVQLYRSGRWGALCDLNVTYKDTKVACRALNLPVDYAQVYNAGRQGRSWFSEIQCYGNETSLSDCSHSSWGQGNCRYRQHLAVKCGNVSPVRLMPGPRSGRVEVYRHGEWGTVCLQNFTYINARVVCQQLGLESDFAQVEDSSKYGKGAKRWLSLVKCSGNESALNECKHAGWTKNNCSQDRDVGVACHSTAPSRLVPGPRRGRLELYRAGEWGTVCSADFSEEEARVACRALGLTSDYAMVMSNSSTQSTRKVLLANVGCSGQENALDICVHDVWGKTYCNSPDVEIECHSYAPTRLAPGPSSGRVEVYRHGVWGTVCGDGFNHLEGKVVCRDLGLKVVYSEVFQDMRQMGTPLLTDLQCRGYESSLSSCSHRGWGPPRCTSRKTVKVSCHQNIPTRLVPGPNQGRLEVYKNGIWGTVCDNDFEINDARVVCRSLNLPMDFIRAVPGAALSQGSGKIWMTYVSCSGREGSLDRCVNSNWRSCSHSRDVGIMCHAVTMDHFRTYENAETRLDCRIVTTMSPPFEYKWIVDGVMRSSGQTPHIRWTFSRSDNNKRVTCQVHKEEHKVGDANITAVVFYPPPPVVFESKIVIEGEDVTVGRHADCNPPPFTYSVQNIEQGLNETNLPSQYVIRTIGRSASGKYVVTLRNRMDVSQGVARDGHGVQVITIKILYNPSLQCKEKYTVYRGSDLKLSCLIDASPFPNTYTWSSLDSNRSLNASKNGNDVIAGIRNVQSADSGRYMCEATNTMRTSNGRVMTGSGSCSTSLNVLYGPTPLGKRSITAIEGSDVTLTSHVDCNPPVHLYRWKKSNSSSDYQSSSSPPVLRNIRRSEAGDYIINVINFMNVTEGVPREGHGVQIITVLVHYKPQLTCQPNYAVYRGFDIKLSCFIVASPIPNYYTWIQKATANTLDSALIENEVSSQIKNIRSHESGQYICEAQNTMRSSSGEVRRGSGSYGPTPLEKNSLSAIEGNDVLLVSFVDCIPPVHLYRWKKSKSKLEYRSSSSPPVLRNIRRSEAGVYTINVINFMNLTEGLPREGHGVQIVTVSVHYPPEVHCEDRYIVPVNGQVNLTCTSNSEPAQSVVTWSKEGWNSNVQSGQDMHFQITNVTLDDAGVYICTIVNYMTDVYGYRRRGVGVCKTNLTVLSPPPMATIYAFEGEDIFLTLPAPSKPTLYMYEWKKLGSETFIRSYRPMIHNVQRSVAGKYVVRLRKKATMNIIMKDVYQIQRTVRVVVLYKPQLMCQNNYVVYRGSDTKLTCFTDASPMPNVYSWSRVSSGRVLYSVLDKDKVLSQITNIRSHESGQYICEAMNTMRSSSGEVRRGSGSCGTSVAVLYDPTPLERQTVTAIEGNDIKFTIVVDSNPPVHLYKWKKSNHVSLYQSSSSSPVLTNIHRSEAGDYIINVINFMNVTEGVPREGHGVQIITLQVHYPPELTCPREHTVLENTSFSLACPVDSSPPPDFITWTRGSEVLQNSTQSQLVTHRAQRVGTAGLFTCTATNSMVDNRGRTRTAVASCEVNVIVAYPPPSLLSSTIDVFEGKTMRLALPVDSNPSPHTYQWRKDVVWSSFRSSLNPPQIINISRSDAGVYSVRVKNLMDITGSGEREGHGVQMITLRVLYPPTISCQSDYAVLEHRSFNLSCKTSSFPASNLTWSREGRVLQTGSSNHLSVFLPSRLMSGMYMCIATNNMTDSDWVSQQGTAVCRMNVTVLYPPPSLVSSTIDVFEGKTMRLALPVYSNPSPQTYQWRKDVVGSSFRSSLNPPEIRNMSRSDAGDYTVRVTNSMDITGSGEREGHGVQMITLRVLYPPMISCQRDYAVLEHHSFNLSCKTSSFPASNLTWFREGRVLQIGSSNHLTVFLPSRLMSGMYTCIATNNMIDSNGLSQQGTAVCRMNVTVLYPPPISTRHYIRALEGQTVCLIFFASWNPPPHLFEWRRLEELDFKVGTTPPILNNIQRSDAGEYIIRLTNQMDLTDAKPRVGRGLQLVNVKVCYAPEVSCLTPQVIHINTTFQLHCSVDSFPPASFVTWSKERKLIQNGTQHYLEMKGIQMSANGVYTCTAYNQLGFINKTIGSGSCAVNVTVVYPPPPLVFASISVFEGSNATLSQPVSSYPQPYSYEWKLRDSLSGYLWSEEPPVLTHIQRTEAGNYMIRVRNKLPVTQGAQREGQGMQSINLKVLYAPEVSCLEHHVVLQNSSVNLTCHVKSFPVPNLVTWNWSGSNTTLEKGKSLYLTVNDTQISQSGMYTCHISNVMENSFGVTVVGNMSCSMSVEVVYPAPPEVIRYLPVFEGSKVTISLPPQSAPPPHVYSWRKEGETTLYTDSPSPPVLHNISRSESGIYSIKVINFLNLTHEKPRQGQGLQTVTVDVLYPPTISCQSDYAVLEHHSFNLSCKTSSFPASNLTWSREGRVLQTGSSNHLSVFLPSRLMSGMYMCIATNNMIDSNGLSQQGTAVCRMNVTVLYPPPISTRHYIRVLEGQTVCLIFFASWNPPPHLFEWRRLEELDFKVGTTPPILNNIQRSDAGEYIIRLTNQMDLTEAKPRVGRGLQLVNVKVCYAPEVSCRTPQVIHINTTFQLHCSVDSFPPASFVTWSKERKLIQNGTQHYLEMKGIQMSANGVYTCTAYNQLGFINKTIGSGSCAVNVTVVYPPPPLVFASISVFEGSNATLSQPVSSYPQPYSYEWKLRDSLSGYLWSEEPPVLTYIQRTEAGNYMIRVRNKLPVTQGAQREGQGMQSINVKVLYAPEVSCLEHHVVLQNSSVNLTCHVKSFPVPNLVTWNWSGSNTTLEKGKSLYLTVNDTQISQSGMYTCHISNVMEDSFGVTVVGNMSCSMSVEVVYPEPPEVIRFLPVFEGSNATVSLPPQSAPPPHVYSWRMEGETTLFADSPSPPVLHNISRSESGIYSIKVINFLSLTHEKPRQGQGLQTVTVDVLFEPELTCKTDVYFLRGSASALEARVESNPEPSTVTWRRISRANLETGFTPVTKPSSTLISADTYEMAEEKSISYLEEEGLIEVSTKRPQFAVKTDATKTDSLDEFGSGISAKEMFSSGGTSGDDLSESKGYQTASGEDGLLEVKSISLSSGESDFESSADNELFQDRERSLDKLTPVMKSTLSRVKRGVRSKELSSYGVFPKQNIGLSEGMVQTAGNEDVFSGQETSGSEQIPDLTFKNELTKLGGAEPHDNDLLFKSEEISGSGDTEVEHFYDPINTEGTDSYEVFTQQPYEDDIVQASGFEDGFSGHHKSGFEEDAGHNKIANFRSADPLENELTIIDKEESGSGSIDVEQIYGSSGYTDFESKSNTVTVSSWNHHHNVTGEASGDNLETIDASGLDSSGHSEDRGMLTVEDHSGEVSGSGLGSGDIADGYDSSISSEVTNMTDIMIKPEPVRVGFVQYEKFYLTNIQSSDEGVYECTASNVMVDYTGEEHNGTASCSINLHVLYPPPRSISASKTVFEGSDVFLSLPPDCLPLPSSYRWRKKGRGTTFNTDINPPVISNISREDAGSYIIEVTNVMNLTTGVRQGLGQQHVTLTVLYGPEVSCMDYVVRRDSALTLFCNINAVPSPSRITWSFDDDIVHVGSNSLIMTNVNMTDVGQYRCDVKSTLADSMGRIESRSASCFSTVSVLSPLHSGQLQVFEDDDLPLSLPDPCVPAPHLYSWRRVSPSTGPLHQISSPPLLLHIRPSDAGLYFVKLTNRMDVTHGESSVGQGVQFVTVKVLFRPSIDCQDEYIMVPYSTVTLSCSVSHALNSSTVTWYRGLDFVGNQSSVTITNATESHIGTYTCSVSTTLVDSLGRIRSWTSICSTKLLLSAEFETSTSSFGLLPRHLLPYIIYIGGSFLLLLFIILLATTAASRRRGSKSQKSEQVTFIQMKKLSRDQENTDSL